MKTHLSYLLSLLLLLSLPSTAQDSLVSSKKKAKEGQNHVGWKSYGGKITLDKATPLASILERQETADSSEVLFEGAVLEVCQGKGCWMVIGDSATNVRVEFKNYGFFVPWDSEGKKVKVQGLLKDKSISAEAAKHMAEEMKHPPVKMEDIKDQQTTTVLVVSAVSINGGSQISAKQRTVIEGKMKHEEHKHKGHVH